MFDFPTAPALYTRWLGAFRSKGAFDAAVPRNNVTETAKVMAGGQAEDFGRLDYIGQQAFVLTAEGHWLALHGEQYGIAKRPAQAADGTIAITTSGALSVAEGATFERADGFVYATTESGSVSAAGTLLLAAVAISNPPINANGSIDGTGASGNADADTPLSILSGVTGATLGTALAAIGAGGFLGGADVEPDGEPYVSDLGTLRGRILWRLRNPPHGGAPADYVLWCSTVPGVTRVFVERRWRGPGTVRVFPIFDGSFANGIPDAARIAAVRQAIEPLIPSVALVSIKAATAQPIDVTVGGLVPNTQAVRNAVAPELVDAFLRLGRVAGVDVAVPGLDYLASPFSFSASWIWQAVANASGERSHRIVTPAADVVVAAGSIPTLGTLSFVP